MAEVHLHLGAHKSATTYLQSILKQYSPGMAARGRFYLSLERTRADLSAPLTKLFRLEQGGIRHHFARQKLRQEVASYLRKLTAIEQQILISDENLIGEARDSLEGQLYPSAHERLKMFGELTPVPVTRVYMSVRDYSAFLVSLWIESLRWGTQVRSDELVAAYTPAKKHWSGVLEAIGAQFPQAQIYLWRYEDFRALRPEILGLMSNLPSDVIGASRNMVMRGGLSDAGVEALIKNLKTTQGSLMRERAFMIAEANHPRTCKDDVFDPWPAELRAELSAVYEQEFATWKDNPAITVLDPAHPLTASAN